MLGQVLERQTVAFNNVKILLNFILFLKITENTKTAEVKPSLLNLKLAFAYFEKLSSIMGCHSENHILPKSQQIKNENSEKNVNPWNSGRGVKA